MWLIVCLLAMRGLAAAQVGGGQITGIVTDQAGAAVPGATVTSTNRETGALRTTVSSSSGLYTIPGLRPGEYSVAVERSGFRTARQEGIRVETGLTRQLDFSLAVRTRVARTRADDADARVELQDPDDQRLVTLGHALEVGWAGVGLLNESAGEVDVAVVETISGRRSGP